MDTEEVQEGERWRPIVDHPKYSISSYARIRMPDGRITHGSKRKEGFFKVDIERTKYTVKDLVAAAFADEVGPRPSDDHHLGFRLFDDHHLGFRLLHDMSPLMRIARRPIMHRIHVGGAAYSDLWRRECHFNVISSSAGTLATMHRFLHQRTTTRLCSGRDIVPKLETVSKDDSARNAT